MAFTSDTHSKLDDAQAQIVRLREQVEALMKDRVTPAVADYAGRAEMRLQHRQRCRARPGQAWSPAGSRMQPLIAIMIAAAAGWLIGRVMR